MWRDSESDKDFLNFAEVADQIAALVGRRHLLPISIGVYGGWGTGKSTVLRLVEKQLDGKGSAALVVQFDAWLYQGFDDARAALLEVVSRDLLEAAKDNESVFKKIGNFLSNRINYVRGLGLLINAGTGFAASMAMGHPPATALAFSGLMAGTAGVKELVAAKGEIATAAKSAKEVVKEAEERTPPKEIALLRKEFAEILDGLDRTLVVFVDNLDRCLPDVAIATLEAMRLFMFMPRTAFVVAADEDMVRRAVAKHFAGLDAAHVRDYLDKVVQVPLRVPRVGAEDLRAYMYSLFVEDAAPEHLAEVQKALLGALQFSWKGASFAKAGISKLCGDPNGLLDRLAIADRLAPILAGAPTVNGNPRIVKRLLNNVMLRSQLAASHGMNMDLATLAKLAVFERCTDEIATVALYTLIMEDGEDRIKELLSPGKELKDPPVAWSNHRDFIEKWRVMDPPFDSVDHLKAAVFLNRDSLAPAPSRSGTSDQFEKAVAALLEVNSVTSPAGKKVVEGLTPNEHQMAMSRLIDEMRDADWAEPVSGVYGAIILASASPAAHALFKSYCSNLEKKTLNKAMSFLLSKQGLI